MSVHLIGHWWLIPCYSMMSLFTLSILAVIHSMSIPYLFANIAEPWKILITLLWIVCMFWLDPIIINTARSTTVIQKVSSLSMVMNYWRQRNCDPTFRSISMCFLSAHIFQASQTLCFLFITVFFVQKII